MAPHPGASLPGKTLAEAAAGGPYRWRCDSRGPPMLPLLARVVLASRYLLAFFFVGLVASLGRSAVRFAAKLWNLAPGGTELPQDDLLIAVLHLVDAALIASLVVIVAFASF